MQEYEIVIYRPVIARANTGVFVRANSEKEAERLGREMFCPMSLFGACSLDWHAVPNSVESPIQPDEVFADDGDDDDDADEGDVIAGKRTLPPYIRVIK